MNYQDISFEKEGHIGIIKLNRPKAMNSISETMLDEFYDLLPKLEADDDIRVVLLTGEGKAFCAGADLKMLLEDIKGGAKPAPNFWTRCRDGFGALINFRKPLVVALNGVACAGGLELAMAGDIILAGKSAQLADAHANFGVFPGAGGAVTLSRKIPWNAANYLLLTGEFVSAEQMKDWGLVFDVVEDEQLFESAMVLATKIASKSPIGLQRMKQMVKDGLDMPHSSALRAEVNLLNVQTKSHDLMEGLTAFGEKRKPEFKGY
ncbi:MAG: enoyl-CoA hydratase [Cellvibrionaceae bacterium]|nr:enoyl-CoA hydratase [Cellvibrionaceae bacterium]|tara:strand:+ start:16358 stop:17146 length:789 start_codon:yes stop_codon:yes gene_type:complete